jgi:hypothetical protein
MCKLDKKIIDFVEKRKIDTKDFPHIISHNVVSVMPYSIKDLMTAKLYKDIDEFKNEKINYVDYKHYKHEVVKYYKKIDCLIIDTYVAKEKRKYWAWTIERTQVITRAKKVYVKFYNHKDIPVDEWSNWYISPDMNCSIQEQKEFHKMFPAISTGGNQYSIIKRNMLERFFTYKEPQKRTGPKQKRIDELV